MDTIVITRDMIPEVETVTVGGKDGTVVAVKRHIPFSSKQVFCAEYVSYVNKTNEDAETMYHDYNRNLIKTVLVCKYYTNIDLGGIETESDLRAVFDWIVFNGLYDAVMDAVKYDLRFIDSMIDDMLYAVRINYEKEHQLEHALKKTFGFLLTGEDFISTLAQMPDINNEIIKAFSAMKNGQPKERKDGKVVTPIGNVVNISRKKS